MTTPAIVMMVVSILLLWGGLAAAIIHLGQSDKKVEPPHGRDL
ncbi:MAG: methionine/alanine import family NSS transporter small subunit [Actinomycetales bacterium]|nr:methionine/alanine import family NSS transporter small subunit [Actinomycetales bacterium]